MKLDNQRIQSHSHLRPRNFLWRYPIRIPSRLSLNELLLRLLNLDAEFRTLLHLRPPCAQAAFPFLPSRQTRFQVSQVLDPRRGGSCNGLHVLTHIVHTFVSFSLSHVSCCLVNHVFPRQSLTRIVLINLRTFSHVFPHLYACLICIHMFYFVLRLPRSSFCI